MSAKPSPSAPPDSAARAGSAHPLRAISFGNPDVTVERRDDGTIYLRPKAQLGDYPVRGLGLTTDVLESQGLSSCHRSSTAWAASGTFRAGCPGCSIS